MSKVQSDRQVPANRGNAVGIIADKAAIARNYTSRQGQIDSSNNSPNFETMASHVKPNVIGAYVAAIDTDSCDTDYEGDAH